MPRNPPAVAGLPRYPHRAHFDQNMRQVVGNPKTRFSAGAARPEPGRREEGRRAGRTNIMMFLLRTTFWVSVMLALLPSFVSGQATTNAPEVGTSEAVTAASATFADLSRFCERRSD